MREAQLPTAHRTRDWGVGLVTAARAALDVAREHGFHAGLAAADSALHRGRSTPAELLEVAEFMTGWPGGITVSRVASHASALRESALESDSFAVFVDHDADLPDCNVWLDEHTRTDFLWRRHRVAGEADGKVKYVQPWRPPETVLWSEKLRQERIEDLGFVVARWTATSTPACMGGARHADAGSRTPDGGRVDNVETGAIPRHYSRRPGPAPLRDRASWML